MNSSLDKSMRLVLLLCVLLVKYQSSSGQIRTLTELDQVDTIEFIVPDVLPDQVIKFAGVYKGKSLFIFNPYLKENKEFCINHVKINDKKVKLNYRTTSMEVNFSGFEKYIPVNLEINHKGECKPRILNRDAIIIHSSFNFEDINLTDTTLNWQTKGDHQQGIYIISYLKYGIWREDTIINAKGVFEGAEYSLDVALRTGSNKYRIKYLLPDGRYLFSKEVENEFYPVPVEISPFEVTDKLNLSRATPWEITTEEGDVLLSGDIKVIPLRKLKAGRYFIRFGEQAEEFVKLKPVKPIPRENQKKTDP